jgi:hypothetical protein
MSPKNFSTNGGGSSQQARIAQRAHEIWEQAGRPEGQALTHWLQAEAEMSVQSRPKQAQVARGQEEAARTRPRRSSQNAPAGVGAG